MPSDYTLCVQCRSQNCTQPRFYCVSNLTTVIDILVAALVRLIISNRFEEGGRRNFPFLKSERMRHPALPPQTRFESRR